MGEAFLWGLVAGSSLVIGGMLALRFRFAPRTIALIMAFGGGVLISALSFDLVAEATDLAGGHGSPVAGLFAGSLVFFAGDWLIDRHGGGARKDSPGRPGGRLSTQHRPGDGSRRDSGIHGDRPDDRLGEEK